MSPAPRLRPHVHRHGHSHDPDMFTGGAVRHYERVARWFLRGLYRRVAADVAAAAPPRAAVLDVGTGPGLLLAEIARRRPDLRVTGVDVSPDMVSAAERHLAHLGDRASVHVADAADLPFEDGMFDLAVCSLSVHHWADVAAGVAEVARVVGPSGEIRVYDLRFAPFDVVADAAARQPNLAERTPTRARLRGGLLPLHCQVV